MRNHMEPPFELLICNFATPFFWGVPFWHFSFAPSCAEADQTSPLQDLLAESGWTAWADAELFACIRYTCGAKNLMVPPPWHQFHALARTMEPTFVDQSNRTSIELSFTA